MTFVGVPRAPSPDPSRARRGCPRHSQWECSHGAPHGVQYLHMRTGTAGGGPLRGHGSSRAQGYCVCPLGLDRPAEAITRAGPNTRTARARRAHGVRCAPHMVGTVLQTDCGPGLLSVWVSLQLEHCIAGGRFYARQPKRYQWTGQIWEGHQESQHTANWPDTEPPGIEQTYGQRWNLEPLYIPHSSFATAIVAKVKNKSRICVVFTTPVCDVWCVMHREDC